MKAIIACDARGGIGYKNKLPWTNIQGDLPRFRKLTRGKVIVMGRSTWESLPIKPLTGRLNFVVSSKNLELPHGAIQIPDLNHFAEFKAAWLIGGAQLLNTHWRMIDEVHLTRIPAKYTCDAYIDLLYLENNFVQTYIEPHEDHIYEIWRRNETIPKLTGRHTE